MLCNTKLIWFGHAWCYHGLSPLKFRNPRKSWRSFLELVLAIASAGQQLALICPMNTPLLHCLKLLWFFPGLCLGAAGCHSCVTMKSSRNFPPREGRAVSWRGFLEAFPFKGMRCFTWKMGFRRWGGEGCSGGWPVWGWDLPGPSPCCWAQSLLLPAPTSF